MIFVRVRFKGMKRIEVKDVTVVNYELAMEDGGEEVYMRDVFRRD